MTILETLHGNSDVSLRQATSRLLSSGCRFVDEALRDNPTGPVQMITGIDHTEITYEVVVGDLDAGDRGKARTVWHRTVTFGHDDRHHAGGAAFVEAAREQDAVAWALVTLIRRAEVES